MCYLLAGNTGKDGAQCPVMCPTKCMDTDIPCYGGSDDNGCTYPEFCFPTYGNIQNQKKSYEQYLLSGPLI